MQRKRGCEKLMPGQPEDLDRRDSSLLEPTTSQERAVVQHESDEERAVVQHESNEEDIGSKSPEAKRSRVGGFDASSSDLGQNGEQVGDLPADTCLLCYENTEQSQPL